MNKEIQTPRTYCGNAGQYPPPTCTDGGEHEWVIESEPSENRSGWHVDRCRKCGIRREYDTSD